MDYVELTKLDIQIQENLLAKYQDEILKLPNYNMVCQTKARKAVYYLSQAGKRQYISEKDSSLIDGIKARHFMMSAIDTLKKNIKAQKKMLASYRPYDYVAINDSLPKVYRLDGISDNGFRQCDDKAVDYLPDCPSPCRESSPFQYEQHKPSHRTSRGMCVRSKSEALIAEILFAEGIPFSYELPLTLYENGSPIEIHPDFTISARNGEKIYWEHMGMISQDDYRQNAINKLLLYLSNGITVPKNLIITMDTHDGSIDVMAVKAFANMILMTNKI